MKTSRNIMIILVLIVISIMSVGYSTFATELIVNGTAEIIGQWNIRIVDIQAVEVSDGCDAGQAQFSDTDVSFNAKLLKPGDEIVYDITIENAGNIAADLDLARFWCPEGEEGSPAIKYSFCAPPEHLEPGEQKSFSIAVIYDEDTKEVPEIKTKTITGKLYYVQSK